MIAEEKASATISFPFEMRRHRRHRRFWSWNRAWVIIISAAQTVVVDDRTTSINWGRRNPWVRPFLVVQLIHRLIATENHSKQFVTRGFLLPQMINSQFYVDIVVAVDSSPFYPSFLSPLSHVLSERDDRAAGWTRSIWAEPPPQLHRPSRRCKTHLSSFELGCMKISGCLCNLSHV